MELTGNMVESNIDYRDDIKRRTYKPLMWVGLVSIIMFFAGLTSALVVSKSTSTWIQFEIPFAFTMSTILIVASSLVYHIGYILMKKNQFGISKILVLITLLLGIGFIISQFNAWGDLYSQGIVAAGSSSTASGSYFYALTLVHLAHLLFGIISLIVVSVKSFTNKYTVDKLLGVQLSITYWHFLGALWIYLYIFLTITLKN